MSDDISPFSSISNIKPFDVRIKEERPHRLKNSSKRQTFGIEFLDDAFDGIYPEDLIVMGAKTGLGKTQLAMHIALANARQGRRITYFALEASLYEIERRIKYQEISDKFFSTINRPKISLNYMDWYYGHFEEELKDIEEEVEQTSFLPNLSIYYRDKDFNIQEFSRVASALKSETDLVIIDHLHYFDHDDVNENKAVKEIVKRIKDMVDITNVPTILISHVRKTDKRLKLLTPEIEDFHGSSDISKIGIKSFCIGPGKFDPVNNIRETYFNILKCRIDGGRTGWVGCVPYSLKEQRYSKEYAIGRLNADGSEFEKAELRFHPYWAKNAKL